MAKKEIPQVWQTKEFHKPWKFAIVLSVNWESETQIAYYSTGFCRWDWHKKARAIRQWFSTFCGSGPLLCCWRAAGVTKLF